MITFPATTGRSIPAVPQFTRACLSTPIRVSLTKASAIPAKQQPNGSIHAESLRSPVSIPKKLGELKGEYQSQRCLMVKSNDIIPILQALGATDNDLESHKDVSNHLDKDPTLPFRESKNGRFLFDFENSKLLRTEFQPFILSKGEDFVRHDSGVTRRFRGLQDDVQLNTAFLALMKFKALMIQGVNISQRDGLNYNSPNFVSTVFNLRTITRKELQGEPALEGVHSDGVDHTMTTFLGAEGMGPGSGITSIHDMQQKTGTAWDKVD